jgi:hypothetical protein
MTVGGTVEDGTKVGVIVQIVWTREYPHEVWGRLTRSAHLEREPGVGLSRNRRENGRAGKDELASGFGSCEHSASSACIAIGNVGAGASWLEQRKPARAAQAGSSGASRLEQNLVGPTRSPRLWLRHSLGDSSP